MVGKNMRKSMLCRLFYGYLKLLDKTVRVRWQQPEVFARHNVVGFWHEDSFAMNLVLKRIAEQDAEVSVLVTADDRGDYIKYVLEKCGGEAVRVGYGFCNAGTLKDILASLKDGKRSVAIAMDGPLGPRHIPKKMIYFLSEQSKLNLTGVTIEYSRVISLTRRWDHYHIPLPFSKIIVQFDDYGITSCRRPPRIREYQNEKECSIMVGGEIPQY